MPEFIGSSQEFKRYVGPRLRNLIQSVTRSHRKSVGACQHCGSGGELEAAHVHGRDRYQIIDEILSPQHSNAVLKVDLDKFEVQFRSAHEPLEKAILVLCKSCHGKYDTPSPAQRIRVNGGNADPDVEAGVDGVLPITLYPSPAAVFKKKLLSAKRATITVYYSDGRVVERLWNASNFNKGSDVMRNLRSRVEFRQGRWQASGIINVHVKVVEGAN